MAWDMGGRTMHPSTVQLLELFAYDHLPEELKQLSKPFHDLANKVAQEPTERGQEQTECLRKLLEAKDCAVRMRVPTGTLRHSGQLNLDEH